MEPLPAFSPIESIPMVLYPLGKAAYAADLHACEAAFYAGDIFVCTNFVLWHGFLHLLAALTVVALLHFLHSHRPKTAYAAAMLYILWFLFQELVDQPVRLHQPFMKAWIDLATWMLPLVMWYVLLVPRTIRRRRVAP